MNEVEYEPSEESVNAFLNRQRNGKSVHERLREFVKQEVALGKLQVTKPVAVITKNPDISKERQEAMEKLLSNPGPSLVIEWGTEGQTRVDPKEPKDEGV